MLGIALSSALFADTYATFTGIVTDPSGANVSGAIITLTNINTGVTYKTESNEKGIYRISTLPPGMYRANVTKEGFKGIVKSDLELHVQDVISVNFELQLGSVVESVTVEAGAALLNESASIGQVIDKKSIADLPVAGGGVYGMIRLTGLPTTTALTRMIDPTSPSQAAAVSVGGARSSNIEFTVQGMPTMSRAMPAKMVPMEAVQEFRMEISPSDASLGHSSGGWVNTSLKSGTNELHGTLWEFHHDRALRALDYFARRWLHNPATGAVDDSKIRRAVSPQAINRFGGSVGGPVYIPRLYNGKNRTFWMYTYENYRWSRSDAAFYTVPTAAERQGDFSALLAVGSQYQIYDPATITPAPSGRYSRQPFPGNIIPANRISSIAQNILPYWPSPNTVGTADGLNNYFSPNPFRTHNSNHAIRADHMFSERSRLSASISVYNQFYTAPSGFYFPNIAVGQNFNDSIRFFVLDYVHILSPTSVLNVRAGTTYWSRQSAPVSEGFDLTVLGFPQRLVQQVGADGAYFPQIVADSFGTLGTTGKNGYTNNTPVLAASVMKTSGHHTIKVGTDIRVLRENLFDVGNASPLFTFSTTWTRGPLDNSAAAPVGQGLASFLLGLPTSGQVTRNASYAEQSTYYGFYVQDDLKLTQKLTLNVGLRYEYEGPVTERFNRSARTFAIGVANPIATQAIANYAQAPIPEIEAGSFRVLGGLTFAGAGDEPRSLWKSDRNNFAPRIGFAYSLDRDTVIRSAYAIMYDQLGINKRSVIQTGFSQATSMVPSLDNGQTFVADLASPFPNGIQQPVGSSLGMRTYLGRGISFYDVNPRTPYMQRWTVSVQRRVKSGTVLDMSYVGNRGTKLLASRQLDTTPRQYLSASPVRDQATINFLSTNVKNPFAGISEFSGTSLSGSTVGRSQLLYAFPQFTSVSGSYSTGYSWYHSLQTRAERRFAAGYTFQFAYTWSKFMEATSYLNDSDPYLQRVISTEDRPHRVSASGIWELPFGKGKKLASGSRGIAQHLIGGWQIEGVYQYQSGQAIPFGNVLFNGDIKSLPLRGDQRSVDRWFDTMGFETASAKQLSGNIRTFPSQLAGLRGPAARVLDTSVVKDFRASDRVSVQLRGEFYNVFNRADLDLPNSSPTSTLFGSITKTQSNSNPRWVWVALKLKF